ncbi:hypothetical protein ROO06_19020 [Klebsiella pneumoniae]
MRDAKDKDRQRAQQEEVKHPQYDVRQLLAEQELATGGRRHVQVDNRPELFLTYYAQGAEHRRDHHQQQRDHRRDDGRQALHVWIVAIAGLDGDERGIALRAALPAGHLLQPGQMHRLYVAAHGFRAVGHRAVHPHADLHRRAAGDIATKVRRDLYRHRQLAVAHPAVQFVIAVQRRLFDKVA